MKKALFAPAMLFLFLTQIITPAKGKETKNVVGGGSGQLSIEQPIWQDFQRILGEKAEALWQEFLKRADFPKDSVSKSLYYGKNVTAIIGQVVKKTGDLRSSPIYYVSRSKLTRDNRESELLRALGDLRKFCEAAVNAEKSGQLLTKEQIDYKPSEEEIALTKRFLGVAQKLYRDREADLERFEPNLISPPSFLTILDGRKYLEVAIVVKNEWGLKDAFFVAKYPLETLKNANDEDMRQIFLDAIQKIQDFLESRKKNADEGEK